MQGYTAIFATCEDTSRLSSYYEALQPKTPVREFMTQSKSIDRGTPMHRLFNLPTKLFLNKNMNADDYHNLTQIYSLLENVYRNALLRPYVPAYRTINTHCGRYRSYIESHQYPLLDRLNFKYSPPNQYTLTESNELNIIKYAIVCGILMNRYSKVYKTLSDSSPTQC